MVGIIFEGDLLQMVSDFNMFVVNNGFGMISSSIVKMGLFGSLYIDIDGIVEWNFDSQLIVGVVGGSVKQVVFYIVLLMMFIVIMVVYNKVVIDNVVKVINVLFGVCELFVYSIGLQVIDDIIFK